MSRVRILLALLALVVALVLQVSVMGHLAWQGVVPNLCLLVVVACGLTLPPSQAMVLGFVAGLLLDLAPPADHVAGRWALALSVVAFVVARVRPDVRPTALGVVATVAAASFVGCSLYALSGVVLSDPATSVGEVLRTVLVGVGWDVLLTPIVLPGLLKLFTRLDPQQATA